MLALTADRPASLRGTGANQTTWQPGMFQLVRRAYDVPESAVGETLASEMAGELAAAASGGGEREGWPGPVHLNLCLVEPLAPSGTREYAVRDVPYQPANGFVVAGVPPAETTPWSRWEGLPGGRPAAVGGPPRGRRGVVVAGDGAGARAAQFAAACGYPLLAEPGSGARWGNAIPRYQWLLAGELGEQVDEVVVFGHPTLSRPVSRLLARSVVPVTVVTQGAAWTDVAGQANVVFDVATPESPVAEDGWLERWRQGASRVAPEGRLGNAWAARTVELVTGDSVQRGIPLFVGASQVIRWADLFAPCPDKAPDAPVPPAAGWQARRDHRHRAGISVAMGRPMRVLAGRPHLLARRGFAEPGVGGVPDLQVIVVNDSGGSIFSRLEHGRPHLADHFERLFAVPQVGL